ncbi:MAG: 30S ribosomal protein S2 [Candidatus Marinimicrobia bacterium]|nr:30S ribosomal protein S2 [Candidatus Neomarinimicrobiota bacterium]
MSEVSFKQLLESGAHFGHLTSKWNPKMQNFVLMKKNGIHILDLNKTEQCLRDAREFLRNVVSKGGDVLFVGTKKQTVNIIRKNADMSGMFYVVERWLGGTLTNFATIKKSIKHLNSLEKMKTAGYPDSLTKKEKLRLERERLKLAELHRGIKSMKKIPDVLIVSDVVYNDTAVKEAKKLNIPVIGIVDTNADPNPIDFPIPANDDSVQTVELIISDLAQAIVEGKKANIDVQPK